MDEILQQLENRIQALIDQCEQLQHINQTLIQGKLQLIQEKEALLAKNTMAIGQIENIVSRLKSSENA